MAGNMKKPSTPKINVPKSDRQRKATVMPQPKNLTPPNATGIKARKPKPKNQADKRVSIGTGKNGLYW